MSDVKLICRSRRGQTGLCDPAPFGPEKAEKVLRFHQSFPGYAPTPLHCLAKLAQELGVGGLYVKDESFRFGLNAFKVLGGSWAMGSYIAQRLGRDMAELSFAAMTSPEVKKQLGELTFVTATDGNHGRGVAWTARQLGQRSIVYMPKGTAPERLANIRALGSEASITDLCYDDAVRLARKRAEEPDCVLVQDTSWEGYETVPTQIMEGYTTMAHEAADQLSGQRPTHVFLQAGVGAMAGAVTAYFAARYGEKDRPTVVIVEPDSADCMFRTAKAEDGSLHFAEGEMHTIMAGLACGEPCAVAWQQLRDHADAYLTMPDRCAARAMRVLGNPLRGDPAITAGESGAAGVGAVLELLTNPDLAEQRKLLGLDRNSKILCLNTEGDTDRANYRRIVWDGAYT